MAELIDIRRVQFDPENMIAHVRIADDAPLMTSEDLDGTARVYRLLPHIVDHVCLGDAGETFRDAMGATELAHLLEHVTVELLAQTDLAGDMPAGRTWVDEVEDRTYQIELSCPDDVLVAAALSCGVWILDWAYRGGGDPEPDVQSIVAGLVQLVDNVGDEGEDLVIDYAQHGPDDEDACAGDEADGESDEAGEADAWDEEPLGEQEEACEEDATEPDAAQAAEPEAPVAPERPLWTPAPDVRSFATVRTEKRSPEVEAEIDQIMATLETTLARPATGSGDVAIPRFSDPDEQ